MTKSQYGAPGRTALIRIKAGRPRAGNERAVRDGDEAQGIVTAVDAKLATGERSRKRLFGAERPQLGTSLHRDVPRRRKLDRALGLEMGQRPRDRLESDAKIVGDVAARHRQSDRSSGLHPLVHLKQEGRDALDGSLAPEQEHVILRMVEAAGRQ